MENFLEETNKIIKEFEVKSSSDAETIGRMAAEIHKLRELNIILNGNKEVLSIQISDNHIEKCANCGNIICFENKPLSFENKPLSFRKKIMKTEIKELVISILENNNGSDNLYMAEASFKKCSPEQMNLEHGESGRTRKEILKEYQDHYDKINEAIEFIRSL